MKIIFLDIDGVLVTRNSIKYQHIKSLSNPSRMFSQKAVRNLNKLIKITKAKIVISSTWRLLHSREKLKEIFKLQGIKGEIISTTSIERVTIEEDIPRGKKITDWLEQHKNIEQYVIIDDDVQADCIQFHPNNCVETSYKRGFATEAKFNEALAILTNS